MRRVRGRWPGIVIVVVIVAGQLTLQTMSQYLVSLGDALAAVLQFVAIMVPVAFGMGTPQVLPAEHERTSARAAWALVPGAVVYLAVSQARGQDLALVVACLGACVVPLLHGHQATSSWWFTRRWVAVVTALVAVVVILTVNPAWAGSRASLLITVTVVGILAVVGLRGAAADATGAAPGARPLGVATALSAITLPRVARAAGVVLMAVLIGVAALPLLSSGGGSGGASSSGILDGQGRWSESPASSAGAPSVGFDVLMDTWARQPAGAADDEAVLVVDAVAPHYWRGMTYDNWDGRTWAQTAGLMEGFSFPADGHTLVGAPLDDQLETIQSVGDIESEVFVQRVTLLRSGNGSLLAAPNVHSVTYPGAGFLQGRDGTIVLDRLVEGAFSYAVESVRPVVDPADLRANDPADVRVPITLDRYLQVPTAFPTRVAELARSITAGTATTYDAIKAIEAWMHDHLEYRRDIPVPAEGVDAVDELLFVQHQGFCEQFATSLTMMLRTLGIPARVAVGYVPGDWDHQLGGYVSTAEMAHAWTEVWFPGIGWQEFDPTADMPLADDPDTAIGRKGFPWLAVAGGLVVIVAIVVGLWMVRRAALRRDGPRRGDRSNEARLQRAVTRLEALGATRARPRAAAETLVEYCRMLGDREHDVRWGEVGRGLSLLSYDRIDPDELDAVEALLDGLAEAPAAAAEAGWSVTLARR